MRKFVLLAALLASTAASAETIIFRHATVVDATSPKPRPQMAVVVTDGTISAVVPDAKAPKGDREVDVAGRYLAPGLVDTHVHLATLANERKADAVLMRDLMGGITAVRDMAGDVRLLADLKRRLKSGELDGPNLYYSALMGGPDFFADPRTHAAASGEIAGKVPWMQEIDDKTDLKEAVAVARGTWASGIKIYADLEADKVAAIVAEAKRQNFPVWAHAAVFPALPQDVAETGLTAISHVCMLAYQLAEGGVARYHHQPQLDYATIPRSDPHYAKLYNTLAEKGVMLDATLHVYKATAEYKAKHPDYPKPICPVDYAGGLVADARKAGVVVTTGSDGETPPDTDYPALWDELTLLQSAARMTPHEVLTAATLNGAKLLGIDEEQGTIEAGKRADFIILDADPLKDIAAVRSLKMTVKGGKVFNRADYRPSPDLMLDNDE